MEIKIKATFPSGKVVEGANAKVLEIISAILGDEIPNFRFEDLTLKEFEQEMEAQWEKMNDNEKQYILLVLGGSYIRVEDETPLEKKYFELEGLLEQRKEEIRNELKKNPWYILLTEGSRFKPKKSLLRELYTEIMENRLDEDSPYWKWALEELDRA